LSLMMDERTDVEDSAIVAPPANRMAMALLALLGIFDAGYLLLHKIGAIGELTCGIGDCGTVQASRFAVFLGVPVPVLGLLGYATLFILALLGLQPSLAGNRRIGAALLALATISFAFSVYLTALEAFVIHAWCQWCVVSAIIATLIFIFALPELSRLRRGGADGNE
jgi:uncharacterized membrane protein